MRKKVDLAPDAHISMGEKIADCFAGTETGAIQIFIASFIMVYFTNVVKVDPAIAAGIIAVSKIFDGITDIIMGYIIDHTYSKHGKARYWIITGSVPAAISLVLAFFMPAGLHGFAQIVYLFLTYNLLTIVGLTVLGVAKGALDGYITINQKDRGIIGGMYMLFSVIISIVLQSSVLQLCSKFGGGNVYSPNGWLAMTIIYAIIFTICSLIGVHFVHERVTITEIEQVLKLKDTGAKLTKNKEKTPFLVTLKALIKNKYWVIFIIAMLMVVLNNSLGSTTIYFTQYVLGDVMLYTPISNVCTLAMLIGVAFSFIGMTKFKKKIIVLTGMGAMVIGLILPMFSLNMTMLYVGAVLRGIGTGLAGCVLPSMLQDTLTYGHWKNGFDMIGMGNAAFSFSQKIGGSLGTLLLGAVLKMGRFNVDLTTQTQFTKAMLTASFTWIPAILIAIALLSILQYDLDYKYDQVVADLKEGKYAMKGEDSSFHKE